MRTLRRSTPAALVTILAVVTLTLAGGYSGGGAADLSSVTGTLPIENGGTNAITATAARTSLGLAIGTNVQAYDADLTTYAGITPSANVQSLLASADYSAVRTNLGLVIGTNVQAYDADLTTYAGITPSANIQSLLGSVDYSAVRTNLGLVIGTNVQAYDDDLTTYAGITPSANIQTLLGSADFSAARTNLSLVIGTNVQAYDADLTTYAGITPSANVQTMLGSADNSAIRSNIGLAIGTNVQAYDADLTTYAGITPSANVQTLLGAANYAAFRTSLSVASLGEDGLTLTATKTAAYTAVAGDHVLCDANAASGSFAVTLPATPANGDRVRVSLITEHATRVVTIADNGNNIMGGGSNDIYYTLVLAGDTVEFKYVGGGAGWMAISGIRTNTAKLRRDAAQSITDNTLVKIAFDAEEFDVGGIGDFTTNDRIDIRRTGQYRITATGGISTVSDATTIITSIYVNGVRTSESQTTHAAGTLSISRPTVNFACALSAGDYVEMYVYDVNTGATSINTDTAIYARPELTVTEVR